MTKQVVEIQDQRINDAWDDVVTIAMRLYKEELDEHWSETIAALSTEWDLKNIDEHTIQKEIFIALVTLELTSLDSLFEEQAAIIRRNVINYLIDLYGNKEHIETLVNDIYYPAAEHALETFYADERFNSVICKRLKQPVSNEVVMTISKLYAHMMGKWYVIKATMDQANSQDATA
jgi:AAA+ ATPase superfamily predicted ATPase